MKKSGKVLSMILAGAMVLSMAGCSGSNAGSETTAAGGDSAAADTTAADTTVAEGGSSDSQAEDG